MKKILFILLISMLTFSLHAQLKVLSDGSTRGGTTGGALRLKTNYKYVDIGCKYSNGDHTHFYTNSDHGFYFDKGFEINGGSISSFTGPIYFKTQRTTKMTLIPNPLSITLPAVLSLDGIGDALGWVTTSDSTLKEDITNIDNSRIADLYSISGKRYKYKVKADTEQRADTISAMKSLKKGNMQPFHFGLLAQDIEDIYPELVFKGPDGKLGINYDGFIPILIHALKDQQKEIEAIKKELAKSINTKSAEQNTFQVSTLAEDCFLSQNRPNPFNESTTIEFFISTNVQKASLFIYDLQGKQQESYIISERGKSSLEISGSSFDAGMYKYALITDNNLVDTKTMILTK